MPRVPDIQQATLTDFVFDRVERQSELRTDAYSGYAELSRHRYRHVVTNLSEAGDSAHVLLPQVHLVASLVKRWILGTHQGAVGHDQLDWYLDEFTFCFNRRRSRHRSLLFYRLIEGALAPIRTPTRLSSPPDRCFALTKPNRWSDVDSQLPQFARRSG